MGLGKVCIFQRPSLEAILLWVVQEPHSGTYYKSIIVMKSKFNCQK